FYINYRFFIHAAVAPKINTLSLHDALPIFFEDADTLRIKRANEYPAATDQRYIDRMIDMISTLISKGLAYQAEDKSVYYRINKLDRKSTRLNSSHQIISYAVFCLKKKK